jgi:hypothetical protein
MKIRTLYRICTHDITLTHTHTQTLSPTHTHTHTHPSPLVSGMARNPKRAMAKENAANTTIPETEVSVCCGEIEERRLEERGDRRGE